MKRLHTLTSGLALAALAASADTGAATAAAAAATPSTSPTANPADKAAPHPDDAKAAAAAATTADDNVADHDADGDGKLRYRVVVEFHDTTTGKTRKKGRTVKADAIRAAQLIAAKVVSETPLEADEPDDEGDDAADVDPTRNANPVAPATVGGPVDQAVIADRGEGAPVTDGNRDGVLPKALSATDAPAIVKGGRAKAS